MRRVKKRYLITIVLHVEASAAETIARSVEQAFGIYGLSRTRPTSVYKQGRYEVVSVLREGLPLVRAALALFSYDKIVVLRVTGTSRKARRIVDSMPRA